MGGGGTARWKSGTQSPRKATCLRIGLEPTGSASGHTVSKTSVPAAPARVADLHDLVGQVPQFCNSRAIGRCRRSAGRTGEPESNGDQHRKSGLLHFALLGHPELASCPSVRMHFLPFTIKADRWSVPKRHRASCPVSLCSQLHLPLWALPRSQRRRQALR
jgi:hypothetical protein